MATRAFPQSSDLFLQLYPMADCCQQTTQDSPLGLFSLSTSNAVKGVSILGIVLFHIILQFNIHPLFNVFGGIFVSVFLLLSGYGLNESYLRYGLSGYWHKRWEKVFLPAILFVCIFNLLWPDGTFRKCIEDLLNIHQTYWFLFHILKCYLLYWLVMSLRTKRPILWLATGAVALFAFSQLWYGNNLESGQTLSFVTGVWLSRNKQQITHRAKKGYTKTLSIFFLIGCFAYAVKLIPQLHSLKYSLVYVVFLLPLYFSWGIFSLAMLVRMHVERYRILQCIGKHSLDIYIAHIPLMCYICDTSTTATFLLYTSVGVAFIHLCKKHIVGDMTLCEMLYVAINAFFVAKYSARIFPSLFPYITFTFMAVMVGIFRLIPKLAQKNYRASRAVAIAMVSIAILAMIAAQYSIDPYSILVDRWSALAFPISNLLSGAYPYAAHTHLGGSASPFPVWQIFHIPFYLLGNVGLSLFATLILYVWSIYKRWHTPTAILAAMLLMGSLAVWYEAAVRSDLVTNMMLTAAFIIYIEKNITTEWTNRHYLLLATGVAMMASTRIITIIPLGMLMLPYAIRMKKSRFIIAALTTILVFVATLIPFAIWNWQEFAHYRHTPWILQTRQGYVSDLLIYIPAFLTLSLKARKTFPCYLRNVSIMLLITVLTSFLHRMFLSGNWNIFDSAYDITYISTALPFCILGIALSQPALNTRAHYSAPPRKQG